MKIKAALLSVLFLILLLVCAQASATTTTVMMYMCGTDLQSDCVNDIYGNCAVSICPATSTSSFRLVVHPNGTIPTYSPMPSTVSLSAIFPSRISNPLAAATWAARMRSSILFQGDRLLPADRYILILWDHGGGPCGASALMKPPITTV